MWVGFFIMRYYRWKIKGSSSQFLLWGAWMSVPVFMVVHPIVLCMWLWTKNVKLMVLLEEKSGNHGYGDISSKWHGNSSNSCYDIPLWTKVLDWLTDQLINIASGKQKKKNEEEKNNLVVNMSNGSHCSSTQKCLQTNPINREIKGQMPCWPQYLTDRWSLGS